MSNQQAIVNQLEEQNKNLKKTVELLTNQLIKQSAPVDLPGETYGWVCCKCRSWSGVFDNFNQGCLTCGNGKPENAESIHEAVERVYGRLENKPPQGREQTIIKGGGPLGKRT